MDKDYIKRKIEKCQRLVDNAISEDQAKVYQGYLDFWNEKLPKKERPEEIALKEEKAEEKAEVEAIKAEMEEANRKQRERKALELKQIAEAKAAQIAVKKAELAALEAEVVESVVDEGLLAEDFEIEFPPKKAYRYQNGDKIKTIAFIEYLNQRTQ